MYEEFDGISMQNVRFRGDTAWKGIRVVAVTVVRKSRTSTLLHRGTEQKDYHFPLISSEYQIEALSTSFTSL
jgi:hypothetical protein